MLITEQLTVAIDFHSMEENTMEVKGYCPKDYCLVTNIYLWGIKSWQNCHFRNTDSQLESILLVMHLKIVCLW